MKKDIIKKVEPYIGIAVMFYAIYAVSATIKSSSAPKLETFVADFALLIWFFWTIVTIDKHTKEKYCDDLVFRYSRVTDGFTEEFDNFCKEYNIGVPEAFAKSAIKREMYRIERIEREAKEGRD